MIDDGIDAHHPFFAPRGLDGAAGVPEGRPRGYTTGKVIVARVVRAAPARRAATACRSTRRSRGTATHVAGILAGRPGPDARRASSGRPTVHGPLGRRAARLARQLPRRSRCPIPSTAPIGSTADLVAAVDAAVNDGMDVINLSIGGTEIDPAVRWARARGAGRRRVGRRRRDRRRQRARAARLRLDRLAGRGGGRDHRRRDELVALLRARLGDQRQRAGAAAAAVVRRGGAGHRPRAAPRSRAACSPRVAVGDARLCTGRLPARFTGVDRARRARRLLGAQEGARREGGGCDRRARAALRREPARARARRDRRARAGRPGARRQRARAYLAAGARASINVRTATREEATLPGRRRHVLVGRADAVRPAAQARHRRAGRGDPLVGARLGSRTSRATGRSSTAPRWRPPRSQARPRSCCRRTRRGRPPTSRPR